ncbi:hypothetical protein EDC96DRAFT_496350 [Choanephora cucurbitarum]|nr:hypothetical protein EDC96DRAFT_496350 [Choanephora cucurbitarum]
MKIKSDIYTPFVSLCYLTTLSYFKRHQEAFLSLLFTLLSLWACFCCNKLHLIFLYKRRERERKTISCILGARSIEESHVPS